MIESLLKPSVTPSYNLQMSDSRFLFSLSTWHSMWATPEIENWREAIRKNSDVTRKREEEDEKRVLNREEELETERGCESHGEKLREKRHQRDR